jgi:hypothetical protein
MGLHPNTCAYSKKPNYVVIQRRVIQQIYNQKIVKITFYSSTSNMDHKKNYNMKKKSDKIAKLK